MTVHVHRGTLTNVTEVHVHLNQQNVQRHGKVASLNSTRAPENIPTVPNQPGEGRRHRSVTFHKNDWALGEIVAKRMETSRNAVLEQFFAWYLRKPGAELPDRPPAEVVEQAFAEWQEQQDERDE